MRARGLFLIVLVGLILGTANLADAGPLFGRGRGMFGGIFGGFFRGIGSIFRGGRGGGGGQGGRGQPEQGVDPENGTSGDQEGIGDGDTEPAEVATGPTSHGNNHAGSGPIIRNANRSPEGRPMANRIPESLVFADDGEVVAAPVASNPIAPTPAPPVRTATISKSNISRDTATPPSLAGAEKPPQKAESLSYPFETIIRQTARMRQMGGCQLTPVQPLPNGSCVAYTAYHCVEGATPAAGNRDSVNVVLAAIGGDKPFTAQVIKSKNPKLVDIAALILPNCSEKNIKFTKLLDAPIPKGTWLQWASKWKPGLYPAVVSGQIPSELKTLVHISSRLAGVRQGDSGGGLFATINGVKYLVAVLSAAEFGPTTVESMNARFTKVGGLRGFTKEIEQQLAAEPRTATPIVDPPRSG